MSTPISRRIKKAREEYDISQKDLGLLLGLSDKAISAYESGRIIPPIDTLVKIAQQLKKPIAYFVNEDTEEYKLQTRFAALERTIINLQKNFLEIKTLIQKLPKERQARKTNSSKHIDSINQAPPTLFS